MPDPAAVRNGRAHAPYREQPSTDSESHLPVAVRVPKNKKRREPQLAQEAYATHAAPHPAGRQSPLVGTPDIGE